MAKIILEEQATPATPATDKVAIYPKAGGGVYKKSDDGVDMPLVEGDGALTEILVGGGANTKPVWTEASGSGAPVRAIEPTLTWAAGKGTFKGIECIVWRMINDDADGNQDPLGGGGADWEISDDTENEAPLLATAVTESSGIFSFASTGYWKIEAGCKFRIDTGDGNERYAAIHIKSTDDNSTYTSIALGYVQLVEIANTAMQTALTDALIKVTNVDNDKVKLVVTTENANTYTNGSEGANVTYIIFTKLADE